MRFLLTAIITLALFCPCATGAISPIDKGSIRFGATALYMNMKGDIYGGEDDGFTLFAVITSTENAISPHLFLGLDFLYVKFENDSRFYSNYDISGLGLGPTLTYYFGRISELGEIKGNIYPFIKASYSFLSLDLIGNEGTFTSLGFRGGISYMITNNTGLDISARYSIDSFKYKESLSSDSGTGLWFGGGISCFIWK